MKRKTIKYVHSEYLLQVADQNPAVKNRASLTHELIAAYGLLEHIQILPPILCKPGDLRGFHTRDYVQQLEKTLLKDASTSSTSSDEDSDPETSEEYGLGFDCPTWSGLSDYVRCIAGATMTACDALCKSPNPSEETIVNLTGGWHHAHRDRAGGYCYVNDIVLGILVLRKRFQRVLYLDLDVHHGDGVQEAFETTKRVFTLSFHQHECGFYPGTGSATDCGFGGAKGYAANFPYRSGITGAMFRKYFKRVTDLILERYQPDACVIQCGADAIVGDPLGGTNLTPSDLIECIAMIWNRNLPTILLGGGGYHFANASRYWTSLMGAICGQSLSDDIPDETPHFLQYGADYTLKIEAKNVKDTNTEEYLEQCAKTIEDNLIMFKVTAV